MIQLNELPVKRFSETDTLSSAIFTKQKKQLKVSSFPASGGRRQDLVLDKFLVLRLHRRGTFIDFFSAMIGATEDIKVPQVAHRIVILFEAEPALPGFSFTLRTQDIHYRTIFGIFFYLHQFMLGLFFKSQDNITND
jgi:hypothetical protein